MAACEILRGISGSLLTKPSRQKKWATAPRLLGGMP